MSDLMQELYKLAPGLKSPTPRFKDEWSPQILETLSTKMPAELIKTRKFDPDDPDSDVMSYMEWPIYAEILDNIVPGWEQEYLGYTDDGRYVVVWLALIIGGKRRVNCGTYDRKNPNEKGDPFSGAYSAAFRRTAAMFGLGRFFYIEDDKMFENFFAPRSDQLAQLAKLIGEKNLSKKAREALKKEERWTIRTARSIIKGLKKLPNIVTTKD